MTREEAIAISVRCRAGDASRTPNQVKSMHENARRRIESYVALGMLKLDEPMSLDAQLAQALGWPEHGRSHGELTAALKIAGLRLVTA